MCIAGTRIWREEVLVDFYKGFATGAECEKCGQKVWTVGTDDRAAKTCVERLRAECRLEPRSNS